MNHGDGPQGEIVIYQTDDGRTKIDVRFVDETPTSRSWGFSPFPVTSRHGRTLKNDKEPPK